jgi:hypothetical protein
MARWPAIALALFLGAACSPPPPARVDPPREPPPAPAPPKPSSGASLVFPSGWWVVERAEHPDASAVGSAFRFDPAGYMLVRRDGVTDYRDCPFERRGNAWHCQLGVPFVLAPVASAGQGERVLLTRREGRLELVRPGAERLKELDALAETTPRPREICDAAERCCSETMSLLGGMCNPERELGDKLSARTCLMSMTGMRKLLELRGGKPPAACLPAE